MMTIEQPVMRLSQPEDQIIEIDDIKIADGSDTRVYVVLEDGASNRRLLREIDPGLANGDAPEPPTLSTAGGSLTDDARGNLVITGLTHDSLTSAGRVHWAVYDNEQAGITVADVKDGANSPVDTGDQPYSTITGVDNSLTAVVGGISAGTEYYVYIALTNGAPGNTTDAAAPIHLTESAIRATDITAPDGSFTAVDGTNAGDIVVRLTNDGTSAEAITTAKYVIYSGGALGSGDDYTTLNAVSAVGGSVVALGNFTGGITAGASQTATADLDPSTQYTVYVLIADGVPNGVVLTPPITLMTKALADPVPMFGTVTATATATNADGTMQTFELTIRDLSENVTIHWAVLTDGTAPPGSAAALKTLVVGTPTSTVGAGDSGSAIAANASAKYTTPAIPVVVDTDYDLYIVATDGASQDSDVSSKIEVTSAADTTAPDVGALTTADFVDDTAGTADKQALSIVLDAVDEAGTLYWRLLGTAPSGTDDAKTTAVVNAAGDLDYDTGSDAAGSKTLGTGDQTLTIEDIVIADDATPGLYVVLEDTATPPNRRLLAEIDPGAADADGDTTAPNATLSASEMDDSTNSTITLSFTGLTEDIAEYWWVLVPNGDAPLEADIRAGKQSDTMTDALASGSSTTAITTGIPTVDLTGIQVGGMVIADGDYEVSVVVEDGATTPNARVLTAALAVTTSSAPTFTTDPTAIASSSKGGQIDLTYTAASTEQVSYVVLAAATSAPTDYADLVGKTGVGTNGEDADVDGTGSNVAIAVSGLTAGDYVVHWVIRTGGIESNIISTPATASATPTFSTAPTAAASSTVGQIDLTYTAESTEQVSYVVLAAATAAPTDYATLVSMFGAGTNAKGTDIDGDGAADPRTVSGLTLGTDYVVYWVIRTGSVESAIIRTPDLGAIPVTGPPTIMNVRLVPGTVTATAFRLDIDLGGAGVTATTFYWVAQLMSAPEIMDDSAGFDAVKNAVIGGTIAAVNTFPLGAGTQRIIVDTLPAVSAADVGTPAGTYRVYMVAETAGGSRSGVVRSPDVEVLAGKPPSGTITTAGLVLSANTLTIPLTDIDETLNVNWAIYPGTTASAPSIVDIKAGSGSVNTGMAFGMDTISPTRSGIPVGYARAIDIGGADLAGSTDYDIYVVLTRGVSTDAVNNTRLAVIDDQNTVEIPSADLGSVTLTAASDAALTENKDLTIPLTNIMGSPDRVYWAVYREGITPTIEGVKIGHDRGNPSPLINFIGVDSTISGTAFTVSKTGISTVAPFRVGDIYEVYFVLTVVVGAVDNLNDGDITNDDDINGLLQRMTVTVTAP